MILTKLKNYALVVAAAMAAGFGYLSFSLYGDLAVAKNDIQSLQAASRQMEEQFQKERAGCEITTGRLEAHIAQMKNRQELLQGHLCELESLPNPTPRETQENAAETISEPSTGDRLDPALTSLLDRAFCSAVPDDPYCAPDKPDRGG